MTNLELKEILINMTKEDTNITEEMIDNVIALNDINFIIEEAKALFTFELWDKVSSINGASANLVLKQLPFTLPNWNGVAYFVKGNGKIIYFQTNDNPGWLPITTEVRAKEMADAQILSLATDGAIQVMLSKLRGE